MVYVIWYMLLLCGIWYMLYGICYVVYVIWYMLYFKCLCVVSLSQPSSRDLDYVPEIGKTECIHNVLHDQIRNVFQNSRMRTDKLKRSTCPCQITFGDYWTFKEQFTEFKVNW